MTAPSNLSDSPAPQRATAPLPAGPVVAATGWPSPGIYDGEFATVNMDRAWIDLGGVSLPPPLSRLRLKQWQHFALVLPDLFVGLSVVDAGFVATSWCHVVDRRTGEHFEHSRMGPGVRLAVSRQLWDGVTRARARGYRVHVHNALERGEHRLELDIAARGDLPAVRGAVRCLHDLAAIQPLVAVLPVGRGRVMYTHKVPLPLEGELVVGDRTYAAQPSDSFALLDIHKAHYPRHTWWKWATLVGRHSSGRTLGLNLTHNVNLDDAELNENALWLDGALHRLGAARFDFQRSDRLAPWRISTACGSVELTFTPQGFRSENLDLRLIRSVFHQLHGTFSGTAQVAGEALAVEELFGLCEDHDSLW